MMTSAFGRRTYVIVLLSSSFLSMIGHSVYNICFVEVPDKRKAIDGGDDNTSSSSSETDSTSEVPSEDQFMKTFSHLKNAAASAFAKIEISGKV